MKGIAFFILLMASSGPAIGREQTRQEKKLKLTTTTQKAQSFLSLWENTDPATLCQKDAVLYKYLKKDRRDNSPSYSFQVRPFKWSAKPLLTRENPGFDRILKPENWIGQFGQKPRSML
ncbi:MAG: hypothetical protein CM1200mP24_03420 [Gammaproteobacteria bacterium]|nr:MAG: hypothetical protein CM1200mP24_03420 [Gammaproteobacteria bacterium]